MSSSLRVAVAVSPKPTDNKGSFCESVSSPALFDAHITCSTSAAVALRIASMSALEYPVPSEVPKSRNNSART